MDEPGLQPFQPDLAKEGLGLRILETPLLGRLHSGTVTALVSRMRLVRAAASTRMTTGAESRNSVR